MYRGSLKYRFFRVAVDVHFIAARLIARLSKFNCRLGINIFHARLLSDLVLKSTDTKSIK